MTESELIAHAARNPELAAEVRRLQDAIRRHRDYRGDDRCHLDDGELYATLPEGDTRPYHETAVTIENCQRFIECRQQDREYVSPQRKIEWLENRLAQVKELRELDVSLLEDDVAKLKALNLELADKYAAQSAALTRAAEIHAEKQREIERLQRRLTQSEASECDLMECEQRLKDEVRRLRERTQSLQDLQARSNALYQEALQRFQQTERQCSEMVARNERLRAVVAQVQEMLPRGGYAWNKVREVLTP